MAVMSTRFLLVHEWHSGRSKAVAEEIVEKSAKIGLHADINCFSSYGKKFTLESESVAVIVTSSTGDDEPSDAESKLYLAIHSKALSEPCLGNLRYALLGLGNSNSTSCWNCTKSIDKRLQELGAMPFYPTGYADDATGLEVALEPWVEGLLVALRSYLGSSGSAVTTNGSSGIEPLSLISEGPLDHATTVLTPTAVTMKMLQDVDCRASDSTVLGGDIATTGTTKKSLSDSISTAEAAAAVASAAAEVMAISQDPAGVATVATSADRVGEGTSADRVGEASFIRSLRHCGKTLTLPTKPGRFLDVIALDSQHNITDDDVWCSKAKTIDPDVRCTSILRADVLTGPAALRKTLLLELSLADTGLSYEPGDAVGLHCKNDAREVQWLLERLKVSKDGAEQPLSIVVRSHSSRKLARAPDHLISSASLRQLFTYCTEIRAVPKKAFICLVAEYTSEDHERQRLLELSSREGSEDYSDIVMARRISVLDLLSFFPSCQPPVEVVLENLPPLQLRSYTAACSQLKQRNSVNILFNIMHLRSFEGQSRTGLCTGWLNQLTTELQAKEVKSCMLPKVLLYPQIKGFRLPCVMELPILMICIGTGVAPFVGFLEHRYQQKVADPNASLGELWLFYGCRHADEDFLFRDMLMGMVHRGVLTKFVVCLSRQKQVKEDQTPRVTDATKLGAAVGPDQASVCQSSCSDSSTGSSVSSREQRQMTNDHESCLGSPSAMQHDASDLRQAPVEALTNKMRIVSGYVQDALAMESRAVGELVWTGGAHVYVCGSSAMAKGVITALTAATATAMDVSATKASAMIKELRLSKRYFECGRVAIS